MTGLESYNYPNNPPPHPPLLTDELEASLLHTQATWFPGAPPILWEVSPLELGLAGTRYIFSIKTVLVQDGDGGSRFGSREALEIWRGQGDGKGLLYSWCRENILFQ